MGSDKGADIERFPPAIQYPAARQWLSGRAAIPEADFMSQRGAMLLTGILTVDRIGHDQEIRATNKQALRLAAEAPVIIAAIRPFPTVCPPE